MRGLFVGHNCHDSTKSELKVALLTVDYVGEDEKENEITFRLRHIDARARCRDSGRGVPLAKLFVHGGLTESSSPAWSRTRDCIALGTQQTAAPGPVQRRVRRLTAIVTRNLMVGTFFAVARIRLPVRVTRRCDALFARDTMHRRQEEPVA